MPYTIQHRPGDKRPMKIRDESGKCVATSTTFERAEVDVRKRYEQGAKK